MNLFDYRQPKGGKLPFIMKMSECLFFPPRLMTLSVMSIFLNLSACDFINGSLNVK